MKNGNNKIRLLYVTYEYGKSLAGGIGRVINGITAHLTGDVVVHVFLLKYSVFRHSWGAYLYRKERGAINEEQYNNYITAIIRLAAAEKYDIVHILHCGEETSVCVQLLRKACRPVKIVYSCHSIAKYEIDIRKNSAGSLQFESTILGNVDHIHVLNRTSLNYLKISYPGIVACIPFSIIPNGIDERDYTEIDAGWRRRLKKRTGANKVIMCMSRWSYGKGLEYLLDAAPIIIKQRKDVRFILAGRKRTLWENQKSLYIRKIDKKIRALKKYIIVMGWLNDVQRNTVFSVADICVMPSLLEYFPYSILEPVVTGVPVLSARIDAVTELLEERRECMLYNPEEPGDLAEKMLYLMQHDDLRNEFSKKANSKVISEFRWKNITAMYLHMYASVKAGYAPDISHNNSLFSKSPAAGK